MFDKYFGDIIKRINKKPFIIGICGMSASGKSIFAKKLSLYLNSLGYDSKVLGVDSYYKDKSDIVDKNYDRIDSFDFSLLEKDLMKLKKGKSIQKPIYSFISCNREGYKDFKSSDVLIIEHIFTFERPIINFLDLKVYIESDKNTCFNRRLKRDKNIRKVKEEKIKWRWETQVIPAYNKHILPKKKLADIIVTN